MKNERSHVEASLTHMRNTLRGSVTIKHNDIGTKGVPDVQNCYLDRTSWMEFKHLKKGQRLQDKCEAQQLVFCHELGTVCGGRSWVIVYEDVPKQTTVWLPRALFAHLWPNVAGPSTDGWQRLDRQPQSVDNDRVNLTGVLRTFGAFHLSGHRHDVAVRLIADALLEERRQRESQ
jgi:hypothetical protein